MSVTKKNKIYLVFSGTDWSDNKVSIMHIAEILSRENKVIFFQTFGRRFPKISEFKRIFTRFKKNKLLNNNLSLASLFALPFSKYEFINIINNFLIKIQINKLINSYQIKKIHVIVSSPIWLDYIKINYNKFNKITFHCVDNLLTYSNAKTFKRRFNEIIKLSNNIVTPNSLLNKKFFSNKAKILTNSVNFDPHKVESKSINKNILYSGTIANWVDFELVNYLVNNLYQYNFYFLSYIHPLVKKKNLSFLDSPNVKFFGKINYTDLPKYYNICDIGIIPYQSKNTHIKFSSPTKVHDYLFFNLKVFSTEIPYIEQIKKDYPDNIVISKNKNIFLNNIKDFYSKNSLSVCSYNETWESRTDKINNLF